MNLELLSKCYGRGSRNGYFRISSFIAAYVPFITYRCFEQIRDDVCKTNLNVNIIGNNSGFSVSSLGPTHVVLEEVAVLRSLPNMNIICPADGIEYSQVLELTSNIKAPVYIRVSKLNQKEYLKMIISWFWES